MTEAVQSGQLNLSNLGSAPEPRHEGPVNYSNEKSSAQSSDIGVAAIRAQQARQENAKRAEAQTLIQDAEQYESRGDYRMARVSLRDAIKLVDDESLKAELQAKLKTLRGK